MRSILFICTKNRYDWNTFISEPASSPPESDLSVLLPQNGRSAESIPLSQVFVLRTDGERGDNCNHYEEISYQEFLEKIFLSELALVI